MKLRDQPKWRRVSSSLFFIAYLIAATFFLIDFINRESGMPLNPLYGFICNVIFGIGLISISIADYVSGYAKSRSVLFMSVFTGVIFLFFASLSMFVYS
ncbi:hypothetical protein [Alkalicoccobacillus porphyridii]|uniref:Uncharacterized protein n=1 Tax=Alkalicoccobacillus porphyridii TaxID=2597270 RepID=A0A554A2K8_9BACI|nr:hypothetical protein [Alkalicoccobacillus porphyridii]TSB47918.1 hypothetical protein FN960_05280 [Alkalicoccobacillus porphyridii]